LMTCLKLSAGRYDVRSSDGEIWRENSDNLTDSVYFSSSSLGMEVGEAGDLR